MMNYENFEIKNQHFNLVKFIFVLVFSLILAVGFTIRMLVDRSAKPVEWCFLICPAILLLLSIAAIILCYKTKFIFSDGVFTYKEPFTKPQSASVENISCVKINKGFNDNHRVSFIDKNGNEALAFTDDGTIIICKLFTGCLERFNIPINYV